MPVTLPIPQATAVPSFATAPVDLVQAITEQGGEKILAEAQEHLADQQVYGVLKSSSRIDVGLWLWFPKIWLFVCEDRLELAAWAGARSRRHAYFHTITRQDLSCVNYNDVTAALMLADHQPDQVPALRCDPAVGYSLVAQIEYLLVTSPDNNS